MKEGNNYMTYDLLTKLLNLKTTNNIDTTIFKRILKSTATRNEQNPGSLIMLFSGNYSKKTLAYFSYLYEEATVSLANIADTLSYLELLSTNLEVLPDFVSKITLSSKIYHKFGDYEFLKDYCLSSRFFKTDMPELQFLFTVLNTLKSQISVYPDIINTYFNTSNFCRSIFENRTLNLEIRNTFLSLVTHGELLTSNEYSSLLYHYLTTYGPESASSLSTLLRNRSIRENPLMFEFITNPTNISLLPLAYAAFCTPEYNNADLKHLNSLKTTKGKLLYLKKLILKYHSIQNKDRKTTKKALSTYLSSLYNSYLDDDLPESNLFEDLNLIEDIMTPYMRINF